MGRYTNIFNFYGDPRPLMDAIGMFLTSEGYTYKIKNNEGVFQKGNGILMGPTFIKIQPSQGQMMVQAWMKYALLPGVYFGEIDLASPIGFAVREPLKNRVSYIENMIIQAGMNSATQYQQNIPPQYAQNIPPQYAQNTPPQNTQNIPPQNYK